jgi:neutral ceramidase
LISSGILGNDAYVVVAGPANTYGHYVATFEEYGVQRYEGASTLFGPREPFIIRHPSCRRIPNSLDTLDAYIDKYGSLVSYLADNAAGVPPSDPAPEDLTNKAMHLTVNGALQ